MSKFSDRFKTIKILVVVPTTGIWNWAFGRDLVALCMAINKHRIGTYKSQEVYFTYVRGSILTKSRLAAVKHARDIDADYLLFIDSDQTFPNSLIHRLVDRKVDVIAANISTKTIPAQPTARNKGASLMDWKQVYTDENSTGIEQVDRVGTGIMLLSRKVLQKLPNDCFDMRYRADVDEVQGEDWSLCEALETLGFPIYIDHDLSKKVGHVGDYVYTHGVVGELVTMPIQQDLDRGIEDVGHTESRSAA